MKDIPDHILEIDKALDEGMSKAIPLIIKQIDKERTDIIIDKLNNLLYTRQYQGANEYYLNGIRESLDLVRGNND